MKKVKEIGIKIAVGVLIAIVVIYLILAITK